MREALVRAGSWGHSFGHKPAIRGLAAKHEIIRARGLRLLDSWRVGGASERDSLESWSRGPVLGIAR